MRYEVAVQFVLLNSISWPSPADKVTSAVSNMGTWRRPGFATAGIFGAWAEEEQGLRNAALAQYP